MNMYSSAPENYVCPICLGVEGKETEDTLIKSGDIVYQDDLVTALINSFFVGKNSGHVIVVPNQHVENLYVLPSKTGTRIFEIAKKVALAMKKAYGCDGITLRQNNEPAGDQHAFHFHLHIFPRYTNDSYNGTLPAEKRLTSPEERAEYVAKLKPLLDAAANHS